MERHEERQLAGRSTAEMVAQTKQEIESGCRVYRKEWLWEARFQSEAEAWDFFMFKFGGRLKDEDVRVEHDASVGGSPYFLMLRRWNVHAEWKDKSLAQQHVALMLEENPDQEIEVVDRNSRREHELISYGILKLPAGKPT